MAAGRWCALLLPLALVVVSVSSQSSVECSQHILQYFTALSQGKLWALQMFDSASKLPSGVLSGAFIQTGNYDECISLRAPGPEAGSAPLFAGKYCRVSLNVSLGLSSSSEDWQHLLRAQAVKNQLGAPETHANLVGGAVPVEWSICAPSSCGDAGVAAVAEQTMSLVTGGAVTFDARVTPNSCYAEDDPSEGLDTAAWITISCFIVLFAIILAATLYEYVIHENKEFSGRYPVLEKAVRPFSLRYNLPRLFSTATPPAGTLTCLNGLRVFSIAWIMLGHRYSTEITIPMINLIGVFIGGLFDDWTLMPIVNSFLAVDTFFFMSGLLTAYVFVTAAMKGKKFNVIQYYVYRYIRLSAPLLAVAMFLAFIALHTGRGPLWNYAMKSMCDACKTEWWNTMIYMTNYVNPMNSKCIIQAWYLAVDMQLYWATPLVLLPLWHWPRVTSPLLALLTLALCFYTFTLTYLQKFPWTYVVIPAAGTNPNFNNAIYENTPHRAVVYLCGIGLGYCLAKYRNRELTLPKWAVWLGWELCTATCLAIVFSVHVCYKSDFVYNEVEAAFYAGFHRLAWALALSWIVVACTKGFGGPVNAVLSWRGMQPFSRLSYCAFLTHFAWMYYMTAITRNPTAFSHYNTVHRYFSDLFATFLLSLVLYLAVEAPTNNLIRALFGKDDTHSKKLGDGDADTTQVPSVETNGHSKTT